MRSPCALLLCPALLTLGLIVSRVSMAREFKLDVVGGVGYNSRVLIGRGNYVPDLTYTFVPNMSLEDAKPPSTYRLAYTPRFVGYLEHTDASVWDQRVALDVARAFDQRTKLSISDAFAYSSSRSSFQDPGDPEAAEVEVLLSRWMTNTAGLELRHAITERMDGVATISHAIKRYESPYYADWDYISAGLRLERAMSLRDSLGLGGTFSYRSFDDYEDPVFQSFFKNSARTKYYNAFLYLQHTFNDDLTILLQGGPTWIQVSRWYFGNLVSQDQFTWFGKARITKRWREVTTSITYNRDETVFGGEGQSAVTDSLTAIGSWQPDDYWRFQLRGSWSNQKSGRSGNQRITIGSVAASVSRRLSRRSSLQLDLQYITQEDRRSGIGTSESETRYGYDRYSGRLGFQYRFSAIRF